MEERRGGETAASTGGADDEYEIRAYEPTDRDAVLALYERTFGGRSEAWFEWYYVENPYLEEVPIVVAEHGGEIVGARPSLPVPLAVGERRVLALVQVDPMVHPDHRRQGLFSRMVTHVYHRYASREPAVSVGFPNEAVRGALEKLGSELSLHAGVSYRFPEYFRVNDPAAMMREETDNSTHLALARLSTPAVGGYLAIRDALASAGGEIAVERVEGVPATRLTALAGEPPPGVVRAVRDEAFYRWRFGDPRYDYRTYLALSGGDPVAAIVARWPSNPETQEHVVHVSEVTPPTRDERGSESRGRDRREKALAALLDCVIEDAADAAGIATGGSAIPPALLAERGFRHRNRFPLSAVSGTNYFVARPLTDEDVEEWTVGDCRLSDPENWQLSYFERELG